MGVIRGTTRKPEGEFFNSLVENALEFAETGAAQLEESPKQSAINFAASVEVFLKARLLLEHWALVVDKPEKATLEKFRKGAFRSVSPGEAIERLQNIAGESLSLHERKSFSGLADHRNKLLHFFHPDYHAKKESAIQEVVSEQIEVWFYLHRLLTIRWARKFRDFQDRFDKLDQRVRGNRRYLDGKYKALKPDIEARSAKGEEFRSCEKCGHEASKCEPSDTSGPLGELI